MLPNGVSRSSKAFLVLLLVSLRPFAHAVCPQVHHDLITQAFAAKPEFLKYADDQAVLDASKEVDYPINPIRGRFSNPAERHSMRPDNTTLFEAQDKAAQYVQGEMRAAVREAKRGGRRGKREAGTHLGRVLHAIQDGKHNWSSCAPDSNPPDSNPEGPNLGCSESFSGCPHKGQGHHGLTFGCWLPRDVPIGEIVVNGVVPAIRDLDWSRLCQGYSTENFQIQTDELFLFLVEQRLEAERQSIDALAEFIKRVKQ